jgi:polyphosphate kinase
LTCRPELGADVSDLFNYLTGYSNQHSYRRLSVAPVNLRERLLALIEREAAVARKGGRAHLIFKCNSLTDPVIIEALYAASQAGVRVDLIIREVCCLRPAVPGLSETISVRSLMGRFVEHSRIFYFRNDGDDEVYLGSADLMSRNMERRVEVLVPLEDRRFVRQLHDVLRLNLEDTVNTHVLQADGSYVCVDGAAVDSQMSLLRQATPAGVRMLSLVQRYIEP